ncbi:hypothetical protein Gbem_2005 [Citrifermentans bemidjiense Bem]|uniref:Vitamin K epoxide reductase domain-containing protein n=1 Tax=Citrifermentans bemidjiense (strain ATCC BAA-1014 / DSM 16622 / JCM 12645 / Bem) TaxID=404380 RepID=B5EBZ4_CITBB|nr:vitamin K epoxide reductase family protein [Citrifermentans bemidjiense]ACH39018.1 hypothetical protein Gbem_2005 [Citrifermentans bemidjiense Bem]
MEPRKIRNELRNCKSRSLSRRRGIVGLSLVAAGSMGLIALYQTGIIRHIPEPPLPRFDADKVVASEEAYAMLHTPDALLGLTSFGATAALAAMEGKDRAAVHPWIPLALAAKLLLDASQAARLSTHQWTRHRAFCFWCLVASGATFASLPLALGETWEAFRQLKRS